MNDFDELDLWDNIRTVEDIATEKLQSRYVQLKQLGHTSIEEDRDNALLDIPNDISSIDVWLDTYLPISSSSEENTGEITYIYSNPVLEQNGTLFSEVFSESFEVSTGKVKRTHRMPLSRYVPDVGTVGMTDAQKLVQQIMRELDSGYNTSAPKRPKMEWTTRESFTTVKGLSEYPSSFTENEFTQMLRKRMVSKRGLWRYVLEDFVSDALEHYVILQEQYPHYTTSQYVNAAISKMNNEHRDKNRLKRKQVDMHLMEESDFPEHYTVEEQVEIDTWIQSQSHVWKKLVKQFMEWNENAPDGAPIPKKFKQRFKRMNKPDVSSHTQTFTKRDSGIRGLRDDVDAYSFPVQTMTKPSRLQINYKHTEKPLQTETPEVLESVSNPSREDNYSMFDEELQQLMDRYSEEPVEVLDEITEEERAEYVKQCSSMSIETWVKKYRKETPSW